MKHIINRKKINFRSIFCKRVENFLLKILTFCLSEDEKSRIIEDSKVREKKEVLADCVIDNSDYLENNRVELDYLREENKRLIWIINQLNINFNNKNYLAIKNIFDSLGFLHNKIEN